ncbi:CheR family methyltransferase [Bordetella genomosp. 11]|uniref:Chemotaxis protein methyltransferase n=1 Tax=Bordetella genomosp. 11 TaxID=1416808 RepID=A0A261UYL4_9BORD|nr:CheR family methyltransferase [Bordetella genomosp. 11]OZI66988.1 SAM-dependent methyltransferase [Bordetella genomosp. 11]
MQPINDKEFAQFQRFIHEAAGITLSDAKKALVSGRLSKRLHARGIDSYGDYFSLLQSDGGAAETQIAIDLLTTNETYFFREPRHFDVLRRLAAEPGPDGRRPKAPFRVWSAASSSGEEAYTAAMVLADCLWAGDTAARPVGVAPVFEVVGTDISTRVLERARSGHYSEQRARQMPDAYRKRYCLKGTGPHAGTLLVDRVLRAHVRFLHANLNAPLPDLGRFDVIFLRNVMIYFDGDTKRKVVERVLGLLKPGGHLCIGHSESLHGVTNAVSSVMPSVYRKP